MKPNLAPEFDNTKSEKVKMIFVDDLLPSPYEPLSRAAMPQEEAHEGWLSLERAGGIIHYLKVRPVKGSKDKYQVGDGWRRRCWSAYGYHEKRMDKYAYAPCVVKDYTDQQMADMIPEANGQRKDMNDIQWGEFYKKYLDDFGGTQESLAERFKKSQPDIANTIRLLSLPVKIQAMIISHEITPSHGRTLLSLKEPALMLEYAAKVKGVGWSVVALDEAIKSRFGKQEPAMVEPAELVTPPAAPAPIVAEVKPSGPDEDTIKAAERLAEEFYSQDFKRGATLAQVKAGRAAHHHAGQYSIETGGYLNGKNIPSDKSIVTIKGKEPVIIPLKQIYDKVMANMPAAPGKPQVEKQDGQTGAAANYIVCHFCEAGAHLSADGSLPDGWEKKTYEQGGFYACPTHTNEAFCRVCGCSEWEPCPGGCYWVEEDLCSACDKSGKKEQGIQDIQEPEPIFVDSKLFEAIKESYSQDKIGGAGPVKNRKIRRPIDHAGKKYICVAFESGEYGDKNCWCHEVVNRGNYQGEICEDPFVHHPARYQGLVVTYRDIQYVMLDPCIMFYTEKKKTVAAPVLPPDKPKWKRKIVIEERDSDVLVTISNEGYSPKNMVFPEQIERLFHGHNPGDYNQHLLETFIEAATADWLTEKESERTFKPEVKIPEGVRKANLVPDEECKKCGLSATDHTLGFKFPDGHGAERKVCIKDYQKWEKEHKTTTAVKDDEGIHEVNVPIKTLEEIYRTDILGQINPGNIKKNRIHDIKWFEHEGSNYVCTGQSWEPRDGGKTSAFCFRIIPRQEFTGEIRDYYDGVEQKKGYFYDRIPVSAPNGEFVLLGPEVIFYAARPSSSAAEPLNPSETKPATTNKISVVVNPSSKELVLNHSYRFITKDHSYKPDITAPDLPTAINTLKLDPSSITQIKVWKSSGKPSTSGAKTTAGWGKCLETIPAAVPSSSVVNKFTKSVRCYQCHETQHMEFEYKESPDRFTPKEHWMGVCPDCKQPNFIENPKWDKMTAEVKEKAVTHD